jgi:hypothetical protein
MKTYRSHFLVLASQFVFTFGSKFIGARPNLNTNGGQRTEKCERRFI